MNISKDTSNKAFGHVDAYKHNQITHAGKSCSKCLKHSKVWFSSCWKCSHYEHSTENIVCKMAAIDRAPIHENYLPVVCNCSKDARLWIFPGMQLLLLVQVPVCQHYLVCNCSKGAENLLVALRRLKMYLKHTGKFVHQTWYHWDHKIFGHCSEPRTHRKALCILDYWGCRRRQPELLG